jgi:ribonuclease HI
MADTPLLRIHTDGASRGNPGAAAYAYIISPEEGPPIEEAGCLGEMTNNQAEYTALIRALEHALELGPAHRLLIHSDSELLVKQMNGEYQVKNEELRGLYEQARKLVRRFKGPVTLVHVRRALNKRADALCNEALDGRRSPTPRAAIPSALTPVPPPAPPLREQVLSCLRQAAAAWAHGAEGPAPEQLWQQLVDLLRQHGVSLPEGSR